MRLLNFFMQKNTSLTCGEKLAARSLDLYFETFFGILFWSLENLTALLIKCHNNLDNLTMNVFLVTLLGMRESTTPKLSIFY